MLNNSFMNGFVIVIAAIVICLVLIILLMLQRKARQGGYAKLGAYLRAAPRSDAEKRDAVDLALKGLVICLLGLILPPFLLIGLIPFFYGARKVAYASMGLGLVDDGDQPQA
jgi:ABC-type Fe3+ transport system permease subunit